MQMSWSYNLRSRGFPSLESVNNQAAQQSTGNPSNNPPLNPINESLESFVSIHSSSSDEDDGIAPFLASVPEFSDASPLRLFKFSHTSTKLFVSDLFGDSNLSRIISPLT